MKPKYVSIIQSKQGSKWYKITFPFDWNTVAEVKTIPGRQFNKTHKYWVAPINPHSTEMLQKQGFVFDKAAKEFIQEVKQIERNLPELTTEIHHLLREYQKEGIAMLEALGGNALLADEMGLGKTVQAIGYMRLHKAETPVCILCPSSLKWNWKAELEKWHSNHNIQVLEGQAPKALWAQIFIINYDILPYWVDKLISKEIKILIADEAHYFKNSKAARTKAVKKLAKKVPNFIPMTGTPIENRPIEIFNAINLLAPDVFPNRYAFGERYCDLKGNGFGLDWGGSSNEEELNKLLKETVMIRRLKKDVLKELPDKQFNNIPLRLSNEKEYIQAKNDLVEWMKGNIESTMRKKIKEQLGDLADMVQLDEKKLRKEQFQKTSKINQLSEIEYLKQIIARGKMKPAMEWIDMFLENDKKLVVFATHKEIINGFMQKYKKIAVKIDGSVPTKQRHEIVQNFQQNKRIKLFFGNFVAAGVGLTLTAASDVALMEYPWTPGQMNQAIDRVHRISQLNSVNVHSFMGIDTLDEDIIKLLHKKMQIANAILDGGKNEDLNIFEDLVNSLLK